MITMEEFELPVPHIYEDGSVSEVFVKHYEGKDFISVRNDNVSILIGSVAQARALARALTIAADLWERV